MIVLAFLVAPAIAHAQGDTGPFGFPPPPPAVAQLETDASPNTTALGPGLTGLTDSGAVTGRTGTNNGTIDFSLHGPGDTNCTGQPVYHETVFYPTGQSASLSTITPFVPTQAGTYRWIARYINDPANTNLAGSCGDPSETTVVNPATTAAISTTASADGALGSVQLTDKASVSNRVNPQPGGSIFFELFAPAANGSPTCSGTPVFETTVPYPQGGGEVTSTPAFAPARAGGYRWRATYIGDANNASAVSPCGAPGEGTTVTRNPGATLGTNPSNPVTIGSGLRLTDRVVVNGLISPVTSGAGRGTIDFRLYGPTDLNCSQAPVFMDLDNNYNGVELESSSYLPARAGRHRWVVDYSGDLNNEPVAGVCSDANSTLVEKKVPSVVIDPSDGFTIGDGDKLSVEAHVSGRVLAQEDARIDFKLYGPGDPDCLGDPLAHPLLIKYPDNQSPTVSSPQIEASVAGTYHWTVTYTGDFNNAEVTSPCVDGAIPVARRSPNIEVDASGPIRLGGGRTLTGQASLTGFFGLQQTGTVDFQLFGPNDTTCTGPEVELLDPEPYPTNAGTVTSDAVGPHAPGIYRWVVVYSGDANNEPDTSACGASDTTTLVSKADPPMTTLASSNVDLGTAALTDTATIVDEFEPKGTATVDFKLFGPNDAGCNQNPPVFTSLGVPVSNHTATSAPFTPTAAGVYRWVATYTGDANNEGAVSACDDPTQTRVVARATPAIASAASPDILLSGGTLTADVTVSNRQFAQPGATVAFRLYGPDDVACSREPIFAPAATAYSEVGAPTLTSAAFTPTRAGTYRWRALYSGDANNVDVDTPCNGPNQNVRVGGVTATLTTNASPNIVLGTGSLTDTATLTGRAQPLATATVSFELFGPDDPGCSGPPVFESPTLPYPVAGGPMTSSSFTPTRAGVYRWTASYSGDDNNVRVDGECNAPGETVTVARSTPSLSASPSPTITLGTGSMTDTVTVNGRLSPTEGGAVDFRAFAPGDTTCSRAPVFSSLGHLYPAAGGQVVSAAYTPTRSGTYRWVASYRGDANNAPVSGACTADNATTVSSGQGQRVPNRAQTRRVTAKTTPKHDRTKLYTFTTTGRVIAPAYCGPTAVPSIVGSACVLPICPAGSIDPADCTRPAQKLLCATGKLTVRLIRIAYTVSTRTVGLRPDCTYRTRVSLKSSSPFRRGALTVRVRFEGNPFLLPKRASSQTVRAG